MNWGAILGGVLLLLFLFPTAATALEFDGTIPADQVAAFDQILEPVLKIYNMVKYIATAVAAVVLLFAGINFIISGSDPKTRESSKSMAMYVVIGLVVIWAAPWVVNFVAQ